MKSSFYQLLHFFLPISFLLLPYQLDAAIKISQISGNWTNTATWGGAGMPVNNEEVIIAAGTTVNLNYAFPINTSILALTIQPGGMLIVTANTSTFRIQNDIINNGVLNLWQSNALQADLILYGNSSWSGSGTWNISSINVQNYGLELKSGLTLNVNGTIYTGLNGSFNKLNKHPDITLNFAGTVNSNLPASSTDFFYGHLSVNKTSGTVSFLPSLVSNLINMSGNLSLVNTNDKLLINDLNTLTINGSVTGLGYISGGGNTGSLIIDNVLATQINPLRIATGTIKDLAINRTAGVVLENGFTVRENLVLNNQCRVVLSNETLVLGDNSPISAGKFSGDGYLVGSANSSISVRGNDPNPTYLRFAQGNPTEYTLKKFTLDKLSGITGLFSNSNLILSGALEVSDNNIYEIGAATLTLNSVNDFFTSGSLRGSFLSSLVIGGTSLVGYSIRFDQSSLSSRSLKSYTQSRKTTVTLTSLLDVSENVSLTGTTSKLASNGNLTLLSSDIYSAYIAALLNSTDIIGEVNVQVFIKGNEIDMAYRGNRLLSTPINDALIASGSKKSVEQLKDYLIITGPNGINNGFDQGGNSQPFAETLVYYSEAALAGQPSFTPVNNINQSLQAGNGVLTFFRGAQMGTYALNAPKLNFPFTAPEPVTVTYKGIINKFDIPFITLSNSLNAGDNFNGYNLIGNPYPSAVDWTKVSRSAGVNDEVIMIKPGGGQATYINGFSSNGGSQYIQTGQGFYVRTSVNGSTVSFKESCKTSAYPSRLLFKNDKLLQNNLSSDVHHKIKSHCKVLRFHVEDKISREETTVVFRKDERDSADYNDAMYFSGGPVKLGSFSADKKLLAVNFMPDLEEIQEINLYISADKNGSYNLNFTEIPSFSGSVYLKDYLKPEGLIKIKKYLSYSFLINRDDPDTYGNSRFVLIFKPERKEDKIISQPDVNKTLTAYPNPVNNEVTFNTEAFSNKNFRLMILNMFGKIIKTSKFLMNEKATMNVFDLKPGIYVAKFRAEESGRILGKTKFLKL